MNYLQICQRTNRESGTASGDSVPTTVVAQSGRNLKIVDWCKTSYDEIQNLHDDWRWLRGEFTGTTTSGSPRYTSDSWSITRFGSWLTYPRNITIYETAEGVSDETELVYMPWEQWRMTYDRGTQTNDRPCFYSISPANEFCLGPIPDDDYTIGGEYQKSPQALAVNADIPEMPGGDSMHMLIVWNAILMLAEHDEGAWPVERANRERQDLLKSLERRQRPMPGRSGPLA